MADGPANTEAKGRYVGPLPNLKDKTAALVIYEQSGRCLAIFDDIATGYGGGYHDFATEHFDVIKP